MKMKNKVNKNIDMSALQTALADMQSMTKDIQTMFGSEVAKTEEELEIEKTGEVEKAGDGSDRTEEHQIDLDNNSITKMEDKKDEDEVEKGIEVTPSKSAVANDTADKIIIDPQSDLSVANVNEVTKAMAVFKAMVEKALVKDIPAEVNKSNDVAIINALNTVSKSLEKISEQTNANSEALGHMFKANGITGHVEKALADAEKVNQTKTTDNTADVLKSLTTLMAGMNNNNVSDVNKGTALNNAGIVNKNLRAGLKSFFN